MGKILIKNGKVWDGETFLYTDILVEGTIISKMENGISEDAEFCYDASGKIVSPGLVDIHTHMLGFYGIHADLSCVPHGVTAAVEASTQANQKDMYNCLLVKHKLLVSCEIEDNRAQLDETEKLLEYYGEKAIGIKTYFDTASVHVRDVRPLKEICDYAKAHHLMVMVHCTGSPVSLTEVIDVLNPGDILTHAFNGSKHNAAEDGFACLKKAKKKGVIIDSGFAGFVHTDFKVFRDAVKEGVLPDTLSTDITRFSAYKRGGKYGMTMCMSMAKNMGMTEEEIFRAVTSSPAKAIGQERKWGYLKVGRCADIAVLEETENAYSLTDEKGNTVEDTVGYSCSLCIVNGEVVYRS